MPKGTANRLCRLWTKRLKLTDWRVRLHILARGADSNFEKYDGWIDWHQDRREADLTLASDLTGRDLEEIIVHELCHLLISGHLPATPKYNVNEERAVCTLAEVLINAYRGPKT